MVKHLLSKKGLSQYILIYLTLCLNDSFLYYQVISKYVWLFIAFAAVLIVIKKRLRRKHVLIAAIGLFLLVVFERLLSGGVGLSIYATWMVHILFSSIAVFYDKDNFLERYINAVVLLAVVSIVYYTLGQINIEFGKKLTLFHFNYQAGKKIIDIDGLLLYCYNPWHYDRNTGIFGEPGLYQIVLNSTLFCILFLQRDSKHKNICIAILLITIITTRSTTGYIGTLLIICGYLFNNKYTKANIKISILAVFLIGTISLFIEYQINGDDSILQRVLFDKLFYNDKFDLSQGSGKYRAGTIILCMESLLQHPLGIGYEAVTDLLQTQDGLVAAKILTSAAACGVQWLAFVLWWIFKPIVRANWSTAAKLTFVALYFNTALAQSEEFYTGFIVVVFLQHIQNEKGKGNKNHESLMVY